MKWDGKSRSDHARVYAPNVILSGTKPPVKTVSRGRSEVSNIHRNG
jgi:hypothetical protein